MKIDLPKTFNSITYREAMERYGSDKPDLRVTLELVDMTEVMKDVDFKVFSSAANMKNGRVAALKFRVEESFRAQKLMPIQSL